MSLSPEALREAINEIKLQLSQIQTTVNKIGIQDERIRHCEASIETMWRKYDKSMETCDQIVRHQASCPRDQLKWVWWVLVPQSLTLIGILMAMFHRMITGK